jgi:hypothetical protein
MSAVSALFRHWFKPLLFGFILVTIACSSGNASTDARSLETPRCRSAGWYAFELRVAGVQRRL